MLRTFCVQLYKQFQICRYRIHLNKKDSSKRMASSAQHVPEILHAPGIFIVRSPKVMENLPSLDNVQETVGSKFSAAETKEPEHNVGCKSYEGIILSTVSSQETTAIRGKLDLITESPRDIDPHLFGCMSETCSSHDSLEDLYQPDSAMNESNAKDNSQVKEEHYDGVESVTSKVSANSATKDSSIEHDGQPGNWCVKEANVYGIDKKEDISTSLSSKQSVLPNEVLQQVTSFVQEKLESNPSEITEANKVTSQVAVQDHKQGPYNVCLQNDKKKSKKRKNNERTEKKALVKNEKRRRNTPPNYFLSVQISNPIIHQNVETVQKYMLEGQSDLQKALVSVPTLHLTLMVMHLASKEDIAKAADILTGCQPFIDNWMKEAELLELSGIGHFKDEVVFVKIPNEKQLNWLQELADHLTSVFQENGISPSDNKGFKPHITILKLSKAPWLKKQGIKKVTSKYYEPYKDCSFGTQAVETVQLCSMLKRKDLQGYYHVEHWIHCSSGVALSARNTQLLILHKFPTSTTTASNIHTTSQESLTHTVTFEREIEWIFIEGEKL